jgi:hypothetical protein
MSAEMSTAPGACLADRAGKSAVLGLLADRLNIGRGHSGVLLAHRAEKSAVLGLLEGRLEIGRGHSGVFLANRAEKSAVLGLLEGGHRCLDCRLRNGAKDSRL